MDRPKVRFSSNLASSNHEKAQEPISNTKEKVKIKSIVPANIPLKILKNNKHVLTDNSQASGCSSPSTTQAACDVLSISSESTLTDPVVLETESMKTNKEKHMDENDVENHMDKRVKIRDSVNNFEKEKILQSIDDYGSNKISGSKDKSNIPCITCFDSDDDEDLQIIKVVKNAQGAKNKIIDSKSKRKTNKTHQIGNKENCSDNTQSNVKKNEVQKCNTDTILRDTTNPGAIKRTTVTPIKKTTKVTKKIQVMPCAKFRQSTSSTNKSKKKTSTLQVKKNPVYNDTEKYTNVSVEPGMSRPNKYDICDDEVEAIFEKRNIAPKDLLSHPEYNSTVNMVKKLKEIEEEKIITEMEHLPQAYKNLIHGKVSAALDFAPYETVYKDLINLSLDDDKFPARMMRSKDPEPRNKDIVPKLSDFYNVKYTDQHFVIANPIVPNPINVNTLSAFTISNKLLTWKMSRDNL